MNLKEAACLLELNREQVEIAIKEGLELPKSKTKKILRAKSINNDYDITSEALDDFISSFEAEEPGRHSPVGVKRKLLQESRHNCGICENSAPLQFHHIVDFAKIKHHDPDSMIAVCGTCHDKISRGDIDVISQKEYKARLKRLWENRNSDIAGKELFPEEGPIRFTWDELVEIITVLHDTLNIKNPTSECKYDFSYSEITKKNELNKMGKNYFNMAKSHHEPYFESIQDFLKNPINSNITEIYYEIVDELNSRISLKQESYDKFEEILIEICDLAIKNNFQKLRGKTRTLNAFLSFMYFVCDLGRK